MKLLTLSLYSRPVDDDGVRPLLSPPVVYDQLLGIVNVEQKVVLLAPLCQVVDFSPVGHLTVVGNQDYHCCVFGELNYQVGAVHGHAVIGVQGVEEGAPVVRVRGAEVP